MKDISIVLPSYKPDEKLLNTVISLENAGFEDIIVVDDGGGEEYKQYFDALRERAGCTVLVHSVNKGKGAALKTAFAWYKDNRTGLGVVTADGDGQHTAQDVLKCAEEMRKTGNIVLGVRDFSASDVPARSRFGNKTTSNVFRLLVGIRITDTQTGLRAIPAELLDIMLGVGGDRYEYETNVLLQMKCSALDFSEVSIRTVYINENETSHFRPVRDSVKIYLLIFKYLLTSSFFKFMGSSMVCYALDWVLFTVLNHIFQGVLADGGISAVATAVSTVGARIVSSLINFFINRKIFTDGKGGIGKTMLKYYALAVCILAVSTVCVYYSSAMLGNVKWIVNIFGHTMLQSVIKLPIDLILYVVSYNVQKKFVFKKAGNN